MKLPLEKLSKRQLISLDSCTRCGECQKWCPVYALDKIEDVTPRAKIKELKRIIESQQSGPFKRFKPQLDESMIENFIKRVFECSCCNQCHFVCPVRLNTVDLWENLRESMYVAGMGPVPEQRTFCETLVRFKNPYKKDQASRTEWVQKGLALGTLLKEPPLIKENSASVLLWIGCTSSYDEKISPVAHDAVNILTKAGVKFGILGTEEECCFGKLRRMGDPQFEQLASKNIKDFNELNITTLVTACAGCYKTFKADYPKIAEQNYEIYHLSEYIDKLLEDGKIKFSKSIPGKITYHDPCLLGRHNGIYEAPRRIIQAIPGLELIEMERHHQHSRCCGVGGGLKMANHDLQEAASALRIKDAEATGANYLTTPCPTCFSGLNGAALKNNSHLKLHHLAELVNIALG